MAVTDFLVCGKLTFVKGLCGSIAVVCSQIKSCYGQITAYYAENFGDKMPKEIMANLEILKENCAK